MIELEQLNYRAVLHNNLKITKIKVLHFYHSHQIITKVHWPLTFYPNGNMTIFTSQVIPFLPNEIITG